jgi:inorganic pyrophosphatase
MDVLKILVKLEVLKWKLFKYDKIEDIQAQEVDTIILFILEYRNVVLSRGMQH